MKECADCGQIINGLNTKGTQKNNQYKSRCGSCYLKWKQTERKKNGQS